MHYYINDKLGNSFKIKVKNNKVKIYRKYLNECFYLGLIQIKKKYKKLIEYNNASIILGQNSYLNIFENILINLGDLIYMYVGHLGFLKFKSESEILNLNNRKYDPKYDLDPNFNLDFNTDPGYAIDKNGNAYLFDANVIVRNNTDPYKYYEDNYLIISGENKKNNIIKNFKNIRKVLNNSGNKVNICYHTNTLAYYSGNRENNVNNLKYYVTLVYLNNTTQEINMKEYNDLITEYGNSVGLSFIKTIVDPINDYFLGLY